MSVLDPLLVGIDLGAGSLKISIIKADGSLVTEASAPVATSSPHPGWSDRILTIGGLRRAMRCGAC